MFQCQVKSIKQQPEPFCSGTFLAQKSVFFDIVLLGRSGPVIENNVFLILSLGWNICFNKANDNEQKKNALKANAQQLTVAQEQLMEELESNSAMAKKLVRFELPKETWPGFGFRKGDYAEKSTAGAEE